MEELKKISFGGKEIFLGYLPNHVELTSKLLYELNLGMGDLSFSHKIGGRWENSYLEVDLVPSVRAPMRLARDLAKEKWNKPTLVLYEPMPNIHNPYPPFWFNVAKVGEITGVHDHAKLSSISGVVYLKSSISSADSILEVAARCFCKYPISGRTILKEAPSPSSLDT
ncbi:MAG: hypothetical protein HN494_16675, partial [Opitutae bacterium]|nr:hypothetical protein [Opitutae bacterium]